MRGLRLERLVQRHYATRAEADILRGRRSPTRLSKKRVGSRLEEARLIDDVRSTAEYRREMVRVLTRRGLRQAMERARA
jgi:carbon-monoxide dehydrogenase medium subunit